MGQLLQGLEIIHFSLSRATLSKYEQHNIVSNCLECLFLHVLEHYMVYRDVLNARGYWNSM